jgi:hypothetical protein
VDTRHQIAADFVQTSWNVDMAHESIAKIMFVFRTVYGILKLESELENLYHSSIFVGHIISLAMNAVKYPRSAV